MRIKCCNATNRPSGLLLNSRKPVWPDPLWLSLQSKTLRLDEALCEPTTVLWRNKEAGPQCKSKNLQSVTVVHFDQGKFEELLSGGGPMLHARKHRKVSMIKVLERKPEPEFCQHPSASCVASQVPCEPRSPLSKQTWRPKQKALNEASGVTTPQVRLSCEEKGKMPAYSNNAASREVTMTFAQFKSNNSRQPRSHERSYCTSGYA